MNERITLKYLISAVLSSFGWDNRFWVTFRDLLIRPQFVIHKYLEGTRKKHTNPFTFFAIVITISVLLNSFYFDELIEMSSNIATMSKTETETAARSLLDKDISESNTGENSLERIQFIEDLSTFLYKNYYYFSFLFLPLYTYIAFLVFRKPNNYAEHLVINTYIQGQVAIFGMFLFLIAIFVRRTETYFWGTFLLTFLYYSYVYQKIRNYSFKQLLGRILKFFMVLFILLLLFGILSFSAGIIISLLK
ncbi:DUF3667 domain-containing protein [Maribellus comscasis]|uniref:DUF3667 domain-containing protein n=1 Tax=Maribellus comscasis TaxID=2681766 RepID=A0A6I6JZD5_9BACT|nr:DUF3667 domain-containing protein [Maribellus comscasis]QGY46659.1 DUF3667 domain-containing protein [Maribellus comscasis]